MRRDTTERGRSAESVTTQLNLTVLPMHNMFVEPSKKFADVIIVNNESNTTVLQKLAVQLMNSLVDGFDRALENKS